MISRLTIFAFLLALLLGVGLFRWNLGRRDACSQYLEGDTRAPSTMYVLSGTRTMIVSCNVWLPRQSMTVQILCLVELMFTVVFLLNGLLDAIRAIGAWKRKRDAWG